MGRKRVKQGVEEALRLAEKVHHLEFTDQDGLYPFSLAWHWTGQNGKKKGEQVFLAIDTELATQQEANWIKKSPARFFYSEFKDDFPWAVTALARALKTACLCQRWSRSLAADSRRAIGDFLLYCRDEGVRLQSSDDLNFSLLCRWRNSFRCSTKQSQYKAQQFRAFTRIVEVLMGTSLLPKPFTLPIYLSDASDPLQLYSDAVMYQLIGACLADADLIMQEAKWLEVVYSDGSLLADVQESGRCKFWENIVRNYLGKFSYRYSARGILSTHTAEERSSLSYEFSRLRKAYPEEGDEFLLKVKFCCPETFPPLAVPFHRLLEKEVATRGSLLPFLLLFMMLSGKNKETVLTWQRLYKINGVEVSPLEWLDPFDQGNCRIRGYKTRGKGRGIVEAEDTYIKIEEDGLYPLLRFVMWYTDPLKGLVAPRSQNSLWLYQTRTEALDMNVAHGFRPAVNAFLERHEIWDYSSDENGNLVKIRITSIDTRRFRKVFASKELLKAIGQSSNHEELCAALMHALNHKSFDTTFGSYIGWGAQKNITDVGIFALQTQYLQEARTFRGKIIPSGGDGVVPGLYTACADPQSADYEGATDQVDCHEFDMCMGCTQSRVFLAHLPRIAMRILQYEGYRSDMAAEAWEASYGRKCARALDVLAMWDDQSAVESAWAAARGGQVVLPDLIFRS
ncbi:hypothetical protein I7860_13845 [Pseudomonas tolaasii]|uniref:hypothetical protein n=1 Tax=Pseudomonas tolaasii TaxID=29442 RepID=UPI001C5735E4|nr:hypothetical protein [Pseudomonas tolaasii]MBW1247762.1 hypothetical protein [Pseudomonas tolaasii]